jgi:hypothetical protein
MKPVKITSLIAAMGLMALAFAWPASAAINIKSCTKEGSCKTASVGTTFEGATEKLVIRAEGESGEIIDTCESHLTAKVTDPTSTGAKDPLEYKITGVTFSKCSAGTLEAGPLPWSVTTNQPSFEETGHLEEAVVLITNWLGCGYAELAPNHLLRVSQDGFFTLLEEGLLRKENGLCLSPLWWYRKTITLFGVNDPNLAGAKSIVIG